MEREQSSIESTEIPGVNQMPPIDAPQVKPEINPNTSSRTPKIITQEEQVYMIQQED